MVPPGGYEPGLEIGRTIGPYRIEGFVGRGGMGEVYRARDERLRRDVAIKVLSHGHSARESARSRFVRETRLASKVVHPYVATVFDVIADEGDLFLVMEYIQGRTLQSVLVSRPTERREATVWAAEIAEALAAIHRAGLVHRDLKPGNIMITPDRHVKVMDFGVARAATTPGAAISDAETEERTLTGKGLGVGTVKYMSPEQIRGGDVDHRSDLFAFGTVLYEMITGTHPFERASVIDTASAIVRESPGGGTLPKTLEEAGGLHRVVLKLLEKDPADRYDSSESVLADLRAILDGRAPVGTGFGLHRRTRRRLVLAGAAFVLGAITFWGAVEVVSWWRGGTRPVIAVIPFDDESKDDAPARGPMLASMLSVSLTDRGSVRALRGDRVDEILAALPGGSSKAARIEQVRRLAAVDWILTGTVYREGEIYVASVELSSPRRGSERGFTVRASSPLEIADRTYDRLQEEFGSDERRRASPPGSAVPESAVSDLFLARRALRDYRLSDAIAHTESALRIAPRFAEAEWVRAQALELAGFGRLALESARRAADLVDAGGEAVSERVALEGAVLRAKLSNDPAARVQAFARLASAFPDDPEVAERHARFLLDRSRAAEALAEADRAIRLDPKDPRPRLVRAEVLTALERPGEAEDELALAARIFGEIGSVRGVAAVAEGRGRAAWKRSDYEAAIAAYREAEETFSRAGESARAARAESDAARLHLILGRLEEADRGLLGAVPVFRRVGLRRESIGNLNAIGAQRFVRGEFDVAERLLRDAVHEARALENPWVDVDPRINLASLLVFTNRPEEGGALAEAAIESAREIGDAEREGKALSLRADAEFQRGRIREARDAYEAVVRLQEAKGGRGEALVWALLGVAETEEAAGRLTSAEERASRALGLARDGALRVPLGYGALARGRVLGQLGRWEDAAAALAESRRNVGAGAERLEDLERRLELTAGLIALMQGRWTEAERALAGPAADRSAPASIRLPAGVSLARATLESGRPVEAERAAREVLEDPAARATDALAARLELARALAALGRERAAAREAERCLEMAATLGLPLPEAEAVSILLSIPRKTGREPDSVLTARGRTAVGRFLSGNTPEVARTIRARKDLATVLAWSEGTAGKAD